jgi:nucleotide-binding universal stress UspA family protein
MTSTYRIVVGIDGSDGGDRALRWAVAEAARHGGTVQAISTWSWAATEAALLAGIGRDDERAGIGRDDEREAAERILDAAVAQATADHPDVTVAAEAVEGDPAAVLTHAARDADLLVLGSHGHGRLFHAVLGSVSEQCIRAAVCPVVVVPVPHHERATPPTDVVAAGQPRVRA